MKLSEIKLGKIVRDGEFEIATKIYDEMPDNCLIYLNEPRPIPPEASCVITKDFIPSDFKGGIVLFEEPKFLFYLYHSSLPTERNENQIGNAEIIQATIYDHDITIGDGSVILPCSTIFDNSIIGNNTIIGSNSVIGGQGFEVVQFDEQNAVVAHRGQVIIKNNVCIQANCCIDKGLFPNKPTIIEDYVCVDNLVHIAHGVTIGKRTRIAAGTCISGYVDIGENVWIGPNCTITHGVKIGDNAFIGIGSVVLKDVEANSKVFGNPAKVIGRN